MIQHLLLEFPPGRKCTRGAPDWCLSHKQMHSTSGLEAWTNSTSRLKSMSILLIRLKRFTCAQCRTSLPPTGCKGICTNWRCKLLFDYWFIMNEEFHWLNEIRHYINITLLQWYYKFVMLREKFTCNVIAIIYLEQVVLQYIKKRFKCDSL